MKFVNTTKHRSAGRILALSASLFALAMDANAQWQVISLHPAGATHSAAARVAGGLQVGRATVDGNDRASLWSGSARSWVSLHPAAMARSVAGNVEDGLVTGVVIDNVGAGHASLWSRADASWIWEDVDASGAALSSATDVDGDLVVGYAGQGLGSYHARLWYRAGGSWAWVELHPAWATESQALGADGGRQVGYVADAAGVRHASVWSGTADSCVDLNPEGAERSSANAVDGDQVVGHARVPGQSGACLWKREGDSWVWVCLQPPGLNEGSGASAVDAGEQVGHVVNVYSRAALWSGTADSYVDLHAFLPREFELSMACGISHDVGHTYVVGYGWNSKRQRQEALMWCAAYSPPPPPTETGTIEGRVFAPNGNAVKEALVTATDQAGSKWETTSAGKQGSYTLSELPAGVYTVEGVKDGVGYAVLDGVQVIAGGTTPGVDLHLLPY